MAVAFTAGDDEREIAAGTLISVESGVRHAVRALEDGRFCSRSVGLEEIGLATRARPAMPGGTEAR